MKDLIIKLLQGRAERAEDLDGTICPGEKVIVFKVETDKFLCKIWNSSNNNRFPKALICTEIGMQLVKDESIVEGRIPFDLNEIMFEIEEK